MSHGILRIELICPRRYNSADEEALYEVFADPYARRFTLRMADRERVRRRSKAEANWK